MNTKLIIAAVAAALLMLSVVAISSALSNARIGRLEGSVDKAAAAADEAVRVSAERTAEAAVYKEKIEYLEKTVAEIRDRAEKQDEQLEKIAAAGRTVRADYDRARRTRAVGSTAGELCEKLARLGHPCER